MRLIHGVPRHSGPSKALGCILALVVFAGCAASRSRHTTSEDPRVGAPDPAALDGDSGGWSESDRIDVSQLPALEPDEAVPSELDIRDLLEPDLSQRSSSPLDELATTDEAPPLTPQQIDAARRLLESDEPEWDMPIVTNAAVMHWVDRYSTQHRQSFQSAYSRSGKYIDSFRERFASYGIPQDMAYMAHVESGFKTSAYSKAHARGIFQFIAATGKRYGLRIDYWADERADPDKSADAAARYMRDLYAEFGDWYLALAAYNAGEGKIRRALAQTGAKDFWGIAETRHIRRETKNHVPAVIAVAIISKQPEKYGFLGDRESTLEYDTVPVKGAADLRVLADCAGTDVTTLQALNPSLRRNQTPPDGSFDLHVPSGRGESTLLALAKIPAGERVLYARHKVQSGDTLSSIASRYGVSVKAIQQANEMGRTTMIRVNQRLLVPTSSASRYSGAESVARVDAPAGEPIKYRVRRGDTLSSIARRHGTTPRVIAEASHVSLQGLLSIGQELLVVPGARSAAEAHRIVGESSRSVSAALTHTVQRGDTLWRIAAAYSTSVGTLCSLNGISPRTTLYPGVKLTVR